MSTQAISQTSIDSFAERVNRLYNRSQKLRDSMVEFGQRWGINLDQDAGPAVTNAQAEPVVQTHTEPEVRNTYVEPVAVNAQPVNTQPVNTQPIAEKSNEMIINHDELDLDSMIAGIKLDDDQLLP